MNYGLVELSSLYQAGISTTEIVRLCGRPAPWIYKRLAEAGVLPNRRKRTPRYMSVEDDPLLPVIQKLRRSGWSLYRISKKVHRSLEYVSRRLTRELRDLHPPPPKPKKPKGRAPFPVTLEEAENFLALHSTGLTTAAIAKLTVRAASTVREHLKRAGLEPNVINANRCSGLWPKINTNMKRAMKGRKFESLVFPLGSVVMAWRNGARR